MNLSAKSKHKNQNPKSKNLHESEINEINSEIY